MQASRPNGGNIEHPPKEGRVVSRVTVSGDTGNEPVSRGYLVSEHGYTLPWGSDIRRAPPGSSLRTRYKNPQFLA